MLRRTAAAAAIAMLAFGATGSLADEADGISVSDSWMRFIMSNRPVGGYFTVRNDGAVERELVGASSSDCGMIMLHKSTAESGTDKMAEVSGVKVPAHGSAMFAPGGFHLMCMKPNGNVEPNKTITITLEFADGDTVDADFEIYGPGGK